MLLKLPDFFNPAKVCELKPTSTDIDDSFLYSIDTRRFES